MDTATSVRVVPAAGRGNRLLRRAHELARSPWDWPVRPRFNRKTRWYGRLAADEYGEAWLLSWLPGQHTDWHDHGGSRGAFVVVCGQLREETVQPDGRVVQPGGRVVRPGRRAARARTLGRGEGRSFGAGHIHRVSNDGPEPVLSVHVYAPALVAMTRYEIVDGTPRVLGVQRAGSDW